MLSVCFQAFQSLFPTLVSSGHAWCRCLHPISVVAPRFCLTSTLTPSSFDWRLVQKCSECFTLKKKQGDKDFWLFHLLLQLIHAEIFTSAFYFFLFKTEKLMEKRTQPFDNRIKTQGLRSIPGRMEGSAPFKANPAECAFTRRSLAAVRNAFMLLQTWRWDNEFVFQRLRLKPHSSGESLPPLWYQKNPPAFIICLSWLQTSGHSWLLLILIKAKFTICCSFFFFYHTHVPLMLPPKCPLNSLSSWRQESVFLILWKKKGEIWCTLKVTETDFFF